MSKFYQGETMNFLFRCKYACGTPADMTGMTVSALFRDVSGEVLFRFSNSGVADTGPVTVKKNYVFFRLMPEDTCTLSGSYVVELKLRKSDLTMIEMTKKIKIYPSAIGEDLEL